MTPVWKCHGAMGFSLGSSLTSLGPGALQHSFASTRVLMPRWDGTTGNRTIRQQQMLVGIMGRAKGSCFTRVVVKLTVFFFNFHPETWGRFSV